MKPKRGRPRKEPPSDDEWRKKNYTFHLWDNAVEELRVAALEHDRSMSSMLGQILQGWLDQRRREL